MSSDELRAAREVAIARAWFAVQAVAGALWWIGVFALDDVRRWTLGEWSPELLVVPDLVLFVGTSAWVAARANRVAAVIVAAWSTLVAVALAVYGLLERAAGWGVVLMAIAAVGSVAAAATIWCGRLPTRWFFVGPFSFRVAAPAANGRHLRRSLAQLVVFWTAFFVIVPIVLGAVERRLSLSWSALDHRSVHVVGIVVFVSASALGLWSCVTMATIGHGTPLPAQTARDLVVAGPYRWVRNPMAVAGALQTIGVGLWIGSWMVVAIALAGAVAWDVVIRPEEERDLAARFGESYAGYAAHVRCWVPVRPWRDGDGDRQVDGSVGGVGETAGPE